MKISIKKTRDPARTMDYFLPRNRSGAMEMSVGTIVTIVLLMTVLILGLVLIRSIFFSAVENVGLTDQAVKNEINKLFTEDDSKMIYVVPNSRLIELKKGSTDLGFGFLINNQMQESQTFSYEVKATEVSCPNSMRLSEADSFISLGKSGNNVIIPADSRMDDAIFVRFNVPETSPACDIRYDLQVYAGSKSNPYGSTIKVDVKIQGE